MFGVQKGVITTIDGGKARVQSMLKKGDITMPLTIPDHIADDLQKGTEVAYVVFEDMTGVILALV